MQYLTKLTLTVLVFAFFFSCSEGYASEITSGSLSVTGLNAGAVFSLTGQSLIVNGSSGDPGSIGAASCFPCTAGSNVSLNGLFSGGSALGSGPATINGTNYSRLYYVGGLSFNAGSIIIPANDSSLVSITAPFIFNGSLSGFTQIPFTPGTPVFTTTCTFPSRKSIQMGA